MMVCRSAWSRVRKWRNASGSPRNARSKRYSRGFPFATCSGSSGWGLATNPPWILAWRPAIPQYKRPPRETSPCRRSLPPSDRCCRRKKHFPTDFGVRPSLEIPWMVWNKNFEGSRTTGGVPGAGIPLRRRLLPNPLQPFNPHFESFMNTALTPNPSEEDIIGPLRLGVAMRIADLMDGIPDITEPLSKEEAFELASRIKLDPSVRRYSSGKPITGTGGGATLGPDLQLSPHPNERRR